MNNKEHLEEAKILELKTKIMRLEHRRIQLIKQNEQLQNVFQSTEMEYETTRNVYRNTFMFQESIIRKIALINNAHLNAELNNASDPVANQQQQQLHEGDANVHAELKKTVSTNHKTISSILKKLDK